MISPAFRSRNSVHGSTRALTVWFWCFALLLVCLVYLGTTGFLPLVGRDEPRSRPRSVQAHEEVLAQLQSETEQLAALVQDLLQLNALEMRQNLAPRERLKNQGARQKPLRPLVEAAFATYLQQVCGEQLEPHFVQVVQQVPHLPPEQQSAA